MVKLSGPALCTGTVRHHRRSPVDHGFTNTVTMIWIDPDDPEALFAGHRLWSTRRPAPVRFRRTDYYDGSTGPIGPALRDQVRNALSIDLDGPIRMLTQPRTWGWLFNPITIYLLWADDGGEAAAAVLEVTNTPWNERHHYVVALDPAAPTRFAKALHVSPFLDEDYHYDLRVADTAGDGPRLVVELDVGTERIQDPIGTEESSGSSTRPGTVLSTRLTVDRATDRSMMTKTLLTHPLPTHRVSWSIHRQALALWRKRVPFVAHPRRRST